MRFFRSLSSSSCSGNATDSEFEDDDTGHVVLPQTLKSRGNTENNKSAVKLHEIGPRLTMELSKIEDGLFNGEVLFHRRVVKTEEELVAIAAEREEKRRVKAIRRKQQEENAASKELTRFEHKERSMGGKKMERFDRNEGPDVSDDDDAAYYEEAVGQKPDEGKSNRLLPTHCHYIYRYRLHCQSSSRSAITLVINVPIRPSTWPDAAMRNADAPNTATAIRRRETERVTRTKQPRNR